MTGLLGGGHAIHYDAATGTARNLDCFCAVPGLGAPRARGGASAPGCAVRRRDRALRGRAGVVRGAGRACRARRAVGGARTPAVGAARRAGVAARARRRRDAARARRVSRDARAGDDAARGRAHVRAGRDAAARPASGSSSRVSCARSSCSPRRARALPTRGTIAASLLELSRRARRPARRLRSARVRGDVERAERDRVARAARCSRATGSPACPQRSRGCRACAGYRRRERVVALVDGARRRAPARRRTRRISSTVDAEGNACVLTTSLGLGSGDWLPGLDLHLNSMLGEVDLLARPARARRADGEHDGAVRRARRRTGSCSRSAPRAVRGCGRALVTVAAGILDEGLEPQDAVDRGRVHPAGEVVNAEPGVDDDGARRARGGRAHRPPLAGAAPLLRRRQRCWGEPERRQTRDGAARRVFLRQAERDPADVAARRAARVLLHGAAAERLRVDLAALQAADALEDGERPACRKLASIPS